MELVISVYNWFTTNYNAIADIVAYTIAIASIIVKMTPTLRDDNVLKEIIKFLGKFIALDKYGPDGQE